MITSLFHYCHPEGLTSAFVYRFAHVIYLKLCRESWEKVREVRKSNSSRSALIPRSCLQKHWASFLYPPLSLCLASLPLSLSVPLLHLLPHSVSFLSLRRSGRSGSVAVFHAETIIICFDTIRSPAVFSQSPSSQQQSTNKVIQNYKSPLVVLALSSLFEHFRVEWFQPEQSLSVRYTTVAL